MLPEVRTAHAAIRDGRIDDALALLDGALARAPDSAAVHTARAMALLVSERFEAGFAEYEWRHRIRGYQGNHPFIPRWDGAPAEGKTLLLWDEQGLGDTIQFARFAAHATRAARARVLFYTAAPLQRLLRSGARGWDVRSREQGFAPADLQLSILSAPAVLRLGAGALAADAAPYLAAEPALGATWQERLRCIGSGVRVGLAWRGNPRYPDDGRRSIPLAALCVLVRRWSPSITFVSLQKGVEPAEIAAAGLPIVDLGPEVDLGADAFVDTAAVMSSLDLVITSDTAIAHLAGALGVPVWVMLARPCDWRWGLSGDRSAFYATARLFRQRTPGDWASAFDAVSAALAVEPVGRRYSS